MMSYHPFVALEISQKTRKTCLALMPSSTKSATGKPEENVKNPHEIEPMKITKFYLQFATKANLCHGLAIPDFRVTIILITVLNIGN